MAPAIIIVLLNVVAVGFVPQVDHVVMFPSG